MQLDIKLVFFINVKMNLKLMCLIGKLIISSPGDKCISHGEFVNDKYKNEMKEMNEYS